MFYHYQKIAWHYRQTSLYINDPAKDPISICRKRISLTAGGMETQKHCIQGGGGGGGQAGERHTMAARFTVTPARHLDMASNETNFSLTAPPTK